MKKMKMRTLYGADHAATNQARAATGAPRSQEPRPTLTLQQAWGPMVVLGDGRFLMSEVPLYMYVCGICRHWSH
jgi:hypothetical protein